MKKGIRMKFQPIIKWTGSKRGLSEEIIKYFPPKIETYYEPFCGGCSVLFQLLNNENIKVNEYICNDINKDLISFFNQIKTNPETIYDEYNTRWKILSSFGDINSKRDYYNEIRKNYNENKNIYDFIFLSRTATNGLIRYNSNGDFNSSFHLTRNGIKPDSFKKIIYYWSNKLVEKNVKFMSVDYSEITPNENDFCFIDPPYFNTTGMYFGVIDFEIFWNYLRNLACRYCLTFDGKRSDVDNTYDVPKDLFTEHVYLDEKISGFKKLHKSKNYVQESLYIRKELR